MSITPFKVHIPDSELELLERKLEFARLPRNLQHAEWGEHNGVDFKFMEETVKYWRTRYNWREAEAQINRLPQFKTAIEVDGSGTLDVHFVHSKSLQPNSRPLFFSHGWPGSFIEVAKILHKLNQAGFDVVAPSLPGYGFSSYAEKAGFKHDQHAELCHKLMKKLGYDEYVVAGGDWGSYVVRTMAVLYPEHVKAMHITQLFLERPDFEKEPEYSASEQAFLERKKWFEQGQFAYSLVQTEKPLTLGFGLHDSPIALLAWIADKLFLWTDEYPWTPDELITWTLLHYFPGPVTGLAMYHENSPNRNLHVSSCATQYIHVPSGVSAFPKELAVVPRSWAETQMRIAFWQEHQHGGHFAAYEKPDELVQDLVMFYNDVWKA